ncbi:MAG: HAD family hydrolase [Balneolaceae bacterium]|nr:HAD family hydrolase [Balneolaceae bacterium]
MTCSEKKNVELVTYEFDAPNTYVYAADNGIHAGTINIADRTKEDSKHAIDRLHTLGISDLVMLSGDNQTVVDHAAAELGLDRAY